MTPKNETQKILIKILAELYDFTEQLAKIEQLEQRSAPDGGETVVPL